MEAALPHLKRSDELRCAAVIGALADSQFMELISSEDLNISSEMQVVEMLAMRQESLGKVPADGYQVLPL